MKGSADVSPPCQHCGAKTQLALCQRCQTDLKDMLTGLAQGQPHPNGQPTPGWLEYIEDAALGRTRLGESARHSTDTTSPMPVNLTASQIYEDTHAMLQKWAETISTKTETLTDTGETGP